MNVKININSAAVKAKFTEKAHDALELMKTQVLKDCNYYAPKDQSILINSSLIHSEVIDNSLHLRWETPYACYQYYGISNSGKPLVYSHVLNPNACKMWAHKAEATKGEQWRRQLQKLLTGSDK